MVRGNAVLPWIVAGVLLMACAACAGKPGPWTSHATFTLKNGAGRPETFTAADSTVPRGNDGNGVIFLGVGLSQNREQFDITIGDDPGQGTNVSQFRVLFTGYHGPGTYLLQAGQDTSPDDVGAAARNAAGSTDKWSMDQSPQAACTVRVTADRGTADRTIRRVTGSLSCHRLYDLARRTRTTALTGHFDVFAKVACGGVHPTQPCVTPPPGAVTRDQ